jgi:large subunit ribosomal protein L24
VIEREAPLHISNVQLVCPACGKPSRVGYRINDDGNKVRVCRACGKDVDS